MICVADLRKWLKTLPASEYVGIDEGGLTLRAVNGPAYLEVGGIPDTDLTFLPEKGAGIDRRADRVKEVRILRVLYTPLYRPPSSSSLPRGWELVERPRLVPNNFERRLDCPISQYTFGVVSYDHILSPDEVEGYQLKEVSRGPNV